MKRSPSKLVLKAVAKKSLKTAYIIKLPDNDTVTLLCLDPAPKSFGMSCFEVTTVKTVIKSIRILEARKLYNTISDPKIDLVDKQQRFSSEVRGLINKYRPHYICLERFLSRGRGGAATAEATNISIGAVLEIARAKKKIVTHTSVVLAVTWKARTKKMFFYSKPTNRKINPKKDTALDHLYRNNTKNPHAIDAFMIGIYFIDAYDYVNNSSNMTQLLSKGLSI